MYLSLIEPYISLWSAFISNSRSIYLDENLFVEEGFKREMTNFGKAIEEITKEIKKPDETLSQIAGHHKNLLSQVPSDLEEAYWSMHSILYSMENPESKNLKIQPYLKLTGDEDVVQCLSEEEKKLEAFLEDFPNDFEEFKLYMQK